VELTARHVLDRLSETISSLREETKLTGKAHYVVYRRGISFGVYKTDEYGHLEFKSRAYCGGREPMPKHLVAVFYTWLPIDPCLSAQRLADQLNEVD
jgi:hypothetical protein